MARLTKQFESDSTEWETPASVFSPLHQEFTFTLDVAADHNNAKCKSFLTAKDDALSLPWNGVCWLNPPYGRGLDKWMQKCASEQIRGVTIVALIPCRTNTNWFHDICIPNAEVRFVRGRPKFGDADQGLPWPLLILVFRGQKP